MSNDNIKQIKTYVQANKELFSLIKNKKELEVVMLKRHVISKFEIGYMQINNDLAFIFKML